MEQKRVLCIDDSPAICRLLKVALESALGVEVFLADSSFQAWKYLRENTPPDLIVLDVVLPGMDGLTFCKKLRADHRFDSTQIALLSGGCSAVSRVSAKAAGAQGCFPKPFEPMTFTKEIRLLLGEGLES